MTVESIFSHKKNWQASNASFVAALFFFSSKWHLCSFGIELFTAPSTVGWGHTAQAALVLAFATGFLCVSEPL